MSTLRSTDEEEKICADPDHFGGVCKHIEQCESVLNEYMARSDEIDHMDYIRESNVNCDNVTSFVCCPFDGRKTNLPETKFQGRLLTPDEGCGFSNKNARVKLARGHKAKLGELC